MGCAHKRPRSSDLERLLHSRIATASDLKLLQASVTRPDEQILPYPALEPSFRTHLYNKLERFKKTGCIYRILKFSLEASSQLGTPWPTSWIIS